MFVYCDETNKHIFKIVSPLGSYTNLVFHTKRYGNIPTGNAVMGTPSNGSVTCRWSRQKSWFLANIWLQCLVNGLTANCNTHTFSRLWQVGDTHCWYPNERVEREEIQQFIKIVRWKKLSFVVC